MKLHNETLAELRAAIGKRGGIKEIMRKTGYSRTWISLVMNGHAVDNEVINEAINYANELKKAGNALNKRIEKKIQKVLEK